MKANVARKIQARQKLKTVTGMKERSKRIVDGCKKRLKGEKDPVKRYIIAMIGQEFNLLYLQL